MRKSKLSIIVFGNVNNYPLLLVRGLRALGHDARLILNHKTAHHMPEALFPEWANAYPDWIYDCSYLTDLDVAYQTQALDHAIYRLTNKVDLAILNDTGPALACFLNAPHISLLTGHDLASHANFESLHIRTGTWHPKLRRSPEGRRYVLRFSDFVVRQRDGILASEVICYFQRGLIPSGDHILDDIGVSDERRFMVYLSNTLDLEYQSLPHNERLTIFCGSRIVYRPDQHPGFSPLDFKGTDVLIKGFAQYVKGGGKGLLRLPRKGQDQEAAAELIADLGIGASVEWLDELPLFAYYKEVAAADLVCDQFGTAFPGMVTTDAYAMGRPVMAKLRNEIFAQHFPEPMPGFDASTPEQICQHLTLLDERRDLLEEMGRKSRRYAEQFLAPEVMAEQLLARYESFL
ncbi:MULTISPECIES: glycosyltransferase family 4 protein [unclassified Haematospirillum]|uniref:glycosyltransferase family 4 protein n=1 Tax=unclassified Haematospirillum TaxID=2622088 RepID=UPI00143BDE01|nr:MULTISPECIES: glycosyltransferase family 4 protein [unclassified Haematospirillum]NKD55218.1 glycosyltransferase family 4 protein [Haematospirillum sp. H4890]NKD75103.1 glycosyltransferase family 4 protein [Haematospirillum sp. H4485]NKD87355.1 glycosyltransferase family 4 protein [Haematospirillum sp. 15-248]